MDKSSSNFNHDDKQVKNKHVGKRNLISADAVKQRLRL